MAVCMVGAVVEADWPARSFAARVTQLLRIRLWKVMLCLRLSNPGNGLRYRAGLIFLDIRLYAQSTLGCMSFATLLVTVVRSGLGSLHRAEADRLHTAGATPELGYRLATRA
jgi:hypothetical protein